MKGFAPVRGKSREVFSERGTLRRDERNRKLFRSCRTNSKRFTEGSCFRLEDGKDSKRLT